MYLLQPYVLSVFPYIGQRRFYSLGRIAHPLKNAVYSEQREYPPYSRYGAQYIAQHAEHQQHESLFCMVHCELIISSEEVWQKKEYAQI